MENIYVGCDVSKAKIDYCILSHDKDKNNSYYGQFENSLDGYEKFLKTVAINYPFKNPLVGFEATGAYTASFQKYLSDNAILHKMFNAKKVSKYMKSLTIQGKTDKSDSFVIAHFASIQKLDVFKSDYSVNKEIFTKYTTILRLLMKIKVQLSNAKKSTSHGCNDVFLEIELEKILHDLKEREKKIRLNAVEHLKELYPVVSILESKYGGLGYRLLLVLVPKIYDNVEEYSINQTIAFLGFNPVSFQSGQMRMNDKLNIFGDKELKRVLYMTALPSTKHNPILKAKFEAYVKNGKSKKLALTIIARKLLVLIIKDIKKYKRDLKND